MSYQLVFEQRANGGTAGTGITPKAYLHILLFSDQFVFDATNSYIQQVSAAANCKQTFTQAIIIPKAGYAYIYFSNESNTVVYFDNFKLTHVRVPLLETDDFYRFGLIQSGISSKAAGKLENKRLYNGKELQNKEFSDGSGLEWEDYGARMYDNQIGRWITIDAKSDVSRRWAPYNYAYDNPLRFIGPDGMRAEDWIEYYDEFGQKHTDWAANINSQAEAEAWAAKQVKDDNGNQKITNVKELGKTAVIERGYTDANGKIQPYQLNADGTSTAMAGGKPAVTKADAANTEPA